VLLSVLAIACGSAERNDPVAAPPATDTPAAPPAPGGMAGETPEGSADPSPLPPESQPVAEDDGKAPIDDGAGAGGSGPIETLAPEQGGPNASAGVGPVPPVEGQPLTIWIAGDSTVANGQTPCPRGWGGAFEALFDERVTVNNAAAGGRSVHTWLYEVLDMLDEETGECALTRDPSGVPLLQPRWQNMLDGMKPGDYLFIQFGINDGDPSCDRHVGIEAFKAAYGMMAEAAKARGANPIFLTPASSIACNGNTARGSRGEFVPATFEAGESFDVPVIDLHARSVELFQSLAFCPVAGGDVSADTTGAVGDFFCDDHTHFSSSGARAIAEVVAQSLTEAALPLAVYLR
jgi:lysophospholipase L1-like esterase